MTADLSIVAAEGTWLNQKMVEEDVAKVWKKI